MKPMSASDTLHTTHLKQSGCQLWARARMTRPEANSPTHTSASRVCYNIDYISHHIQHNKEHKVPDNRAHNIFCLRATITGRTTHHVLTLLLYLEVQPIREWLKALDTPTENERIRSADYQYAVTYTKHF